MRPAVLLFILSLVILLFTISGLKIEMRAMSAAQSQTQGQMPAPGQFPPPPPTSVPPSMPVVGTDMVNDVVDAQMTTTTNMGLDPNVKLIQHEGYSYDPSGQRDPFLPFIDPNPPAPDPKINLTKDKKETKAEEDKTESLTSFDLGQFTLVGVIWNVDDPKAMVQTPNGKMFIVRNRMKIGRNNGFVAAIREGEIVVVEPDPDGTGAQSYILGLTR